MFTGATGAMIRDDKGLFIACSNSNYGLPSISDTAMAEACPLSDGLLLAGHVGCTKLIVNSLWTPSQCKIFFSIRSVFITQKVQVNTPDLRITRMHTAV
jgi:hypothetical protein